MPIERSPPSAAACRWFFSDRVAAVRPMPNSGYSGSSTLLVEAAESGGEPERWVLKSFAAAATASAATWIHGLMDHLTDCRVACVPRLRRASSPRGDDEEVRVVRETLVEDTSGTLWEAARWLPGLPIPNPTREEAEAAVAALAAIHDAAATWPQAPPRVEPPRSLAARVERARELCTRPMHRRLERARTTRSAAHSIPDRLAAAFELAAFELSRHERALEQVASVIVPPLPCQAVVRDVWSDHVLFDEGRVSGIVDYHAAGIDTVATDLARLIGSWRLASPDGACRLPWEALIERYISTRSRRPGPTHHSTHGRLLPSLVPLLHEAGVIVGIDNWFRWIVEEERSFPDHDPVASRVAMLTAALPRALAALPDAIAAFRSAVVAGD